MKKPPFVSRCGECGHAFIDADLIECPCGAYCEECHKAHRQECKLCQEAWEEENR